ncbi:hypothetical protein MRB53_038387 [Persea americana]|nr:hypothetical protein MRB53_038387 [Persea americana]
MFRVITSRHGWCESQHWCSPNECSASQHECCRRFSMCMSCFVLVHRGQREESRNATIGRRHFAFYGQPVALINTGNSFGTYQRSRLGKRVRDIRPKQDIQQRATPGQAHCLVLRRKRFERESSFIRPLVERRHYEYLEITWTAGRAGAGFETRENMTFAPFRE